MLALGNHGIMDTSRKIQVSKQPTIRPSSHEEDMRNFPNGSS